MRYEEALVVGVISNRLHKRQPIRYYYSDKQMCYGSSTGNLVQRISTQCDSLFVHKPCFSPIKIKYQVGDSTVGDNIMSVQHVTKWCKQSKHGQMDIHDEYCTRWPSTRKNVNAAQVEELLLGQ